MSARTINRAATFAIALLAVCAGSVSALAQEIVLIPNRVIYPGETISMDILKEVTLKPGKIIPPAVAVTLPELDGKVAVRTLLPGRYISGGSLREAWVVERGASVQMIFVSGGLTISATAVTLEPGATGDYVKVRNIDSGKILSGTVMADEPIQGRSNMNRLRMLAMFAAFALAPAVSSAADMPVDYPPDGNSVQFPAPANGVPVGQEGTQGKLVRYSIGDSNLPSHGGTVSRIKDIAQLQSARDNQLVGYGLVIGLQGTGDSLRNSPFTEQSMRAMLENLGIASEGGRARANNVAAVIVTANMPPFVQSGARIDVSVASLGDASSIFGGTLVMTPMKAADGEIYAVAQGPVFSGFSAEGQAESVSKGVPTAGLIPNGAIIERQVEASFANQSTMVLQLRNADFSTSVKVADAINVYSGARFGGRVAQEQDARTIVIRKPKDISPARFYAEIENIIVETDVPARVVIDNRTGTIVIGNDVRISRVAVSHGAVTVRITEAPQVVQPEPFSRGETAIEPYTAIDASQPDAHVAVIDGPNLDTLVSGLNRLGVKPDGIIAILQGIKTAGAMQADLVLQ